MTEASRGEQSEGGGQGSGDDDPSPSGASTPDWSGLLARARRLPPRWGVGDRLAVVSLVALLFGLVLPWGTEPYDRPLALPHAVGTGGVLAGALLASVAVAVAVVGRGALPSGLPYLLLPASLVAGVGALPVRAAERVSLPLLVPGRIATLLGAVGLVVASGVLTQSSDVAEQEVARQRLAARKRVDAPTARQQVEQLVADAAPDEPSIGAGSWGTAAPVLLVVATAAAVAGPWWRMPGRLHGPVWFGDDDFYARQVLSAEQSGGVVRSGIEVLGDSRAWAVGGLTALALVVVLLGARRAAPAVAVAAAAVAALVVAGMAGTRVGGLPLPWIAVAAAVAAVVAATRAWWSASRRLHRFAVVPGVLLGLSAVVVVDGPPARQGPTTDGPYRVLAGGSVDAEDDRVDTLAGAPADRLQAGSAMWFHGEPAALTETDEGVVLWTVDDGRGEVRAATDGGIALGQGDGSTADSTLIHYQFGDERPAPALWTIGEELVPLPAGVEEASLGPDGQLWMTSTLDPYSNAVHVVPVEELTGGTGGTTRVDDWPEVLPTEEVTWGIRGVDGGVLVGIGPIGQDGLALVEADGSTRTVLGSPSPPDATCGLNREATGSMVNPDYARGDYDSLTDVVGLARVAVSAHDGGLWVVLPAPEPEGDRVHALGRVDPDGTLRLVDHALPPIESIAAHPDRDAVLLVDQAGRLLELADADRHAEPLPPPPDGCYPEVPTVAPPAQLAPVPGSSDGHLLDAAGTRLRVDDLPDERARLTRVAPDGTEEVIAETDTLSSRNQIAPDGAGGAWWLAGDEGPLPVAPGDEGETRRWAIRPVHLLPTGEIEESAPALSGEVPPSEDVSFQIWADGDTAYVVVATRPESGEQTVTITRVTGTTSEVVYRGPAMNRQGELSNFVATRAGEVVARSDGRVQHLIGDRSEPLVGGAAPVVEGRTLPVEVAAGLDPDRLDLAEVAITADPHGDGVLLVEDGLVARVGLDGSFTPIAQDPRLDGDARLLDGQLVVDDYFGNTYVVEVP